MWRFLTAAGARLGFLVGYTLAEALICSGAYNMVGPKFGAPELSYLEIAAVVFAALSLAESMGRLALLKDA